MTWSHKAWGPLSEIFKILGVVGVSFVALAGLLGCASLLPPPQSPNQEFRPQVREVPFAARAVGEESLRQRLLVLPFQEPDSFKGQRVGEEARRRLIAELERTRQFILVRPEDLRQDLLQLRLPDGRYDLAEISRAAGQAGVAAVLEGHIVEVQSRRMSDPVGLVRQVRAQVEARVQVRLFAARNGRELLNEQHSSQVTAAITRVAQYAETDRHLSEDPQLARRSVREAFFRAIPSITRAVEKLSWEGRVAMISGERIFVNAGRLSGLEIGDILKITEEGPEVFDPDTGLFIGRAPGRIKGTVEVISYFGQDGSITIVHSGSGFRENDRVELY